MHDTLCNFLVLCFCRCTFWLQWNNICLWPNRLWKIVFNAGYYRSSHSERNYSKVCYFVLAVCLITRCNIESCFCSSIAKTFLCEMLWLDLWRRYVLLIAVLKVNMGIIPHQLISFYFCHQKMLTEAGCKFFWSRIATAEVLSYQFLWLLHSITVWYR